MINTSDIIINFKDLKKQESTPIGILKNFNIGDHIQVRWPERGKGKSQGPGKESYKSEGVIVQITGTVVYYRCKAGYICSVSKHQMMSDVPVTVVQKAKIA